MTKKYTLNKSQIRNLSWGKFKDKQLQQHLEQISQENSDTLNDWHCGVVAARGWHQLTGEIMRGTIDCDTPMIVLSETDLKRLLNKGNIGKTWDKKPEPTQTTNAIFGEVRALFNGPASSDKWTLLLTYLDQCQGDDVEKLVSYIISCLNQWIEHPMPKWTPSKHEYHVHYIEFGPWSKALPDGQLCVAPPRWLMEMAQGKYHEKHSIVRVLNLNRMKVDWQIMQNILDNPYLINVNHLDLGDNVALCGNKSFYTTLRKHPMMKTVTTLTTYALTTSFIKAIEGLNHPEHTLEQLNTLNVYYQAAAANWGPTLQKMQTYPCFQNVTMHGHRTNAYIQAYL